MSSMNDRPRAFSYLRFSTPEQQKGELLERLRELEPHSAGIQAIHVPEAGIVNYAAVSRKVAKDLDLNPVPIQKKFLDL